MSMISIECTGFQEKQTQKKIFAEEKTFAWPNQTADEVAVEKTLSDICSCFVIPGTAVRLCIPVQSWRGCRQCLCDCLEGSRNMLHYCLDFALEMERNLGR